MNDLPITIENISGAATAIAGAVARTPTIASPALSALAGCDIRLKLEILHRTGSFKERGALNKLLTLTREERRAGVVAMSAGNHAQGVAYHAQRLGIPATIVMPEGTPFTKVERTEAFGATVLLKGDSLVAARQAAEALARDRGLVFVHPYDDPAIIAGQGTIGLELLADCPDLDVLVVPVGGGGLISGSAVAALAMKPGIEVLGVEVETYSAMAQRLAGRPVSVGGSTIAEGIAVRDVGELPVAILREMGIEVLVVPESAIEQAIALLAEGAKLVAEGAGAAALAAVLHYPDRFAGRRIGLPICGGNIDARILANTLLRNLLRDGRLVRLIMEMPDRPGMLGDISTRIGDEGGNIIEVAHHRLFTSPTVQAAQLEIMIEARDAAHGAFIESKLRERYIVRRA